LRPPPAPRPPHQPPPPPLPTTPPPPSVRQPAIFTQKAGIPQPVPLNIPGNQTQRTPFASAPPPSDFRFSSHLLIPTFLPELHNCFHSSSPLPIFLPFSYEKVEGGGPKPAPFFFNHFFSPRNSVGPADRGRFLRYPQQPV